MTSLDWAVAAAPKPGHDVSGDTHRVRAFAQGTLVTVIDGIGHGPEAHKAAQAAAAVVDELVAPQPLTALIEACHLASRRTRGVVMSALWFSIEPPELEWVGVGNVDAVLRKRSPNAPKKRERLSTAGGIVGERLPRLQPAVVALATDDLVVIATDGAPGAVLDNGSIAAASVQSIADELLHKHAHRADDALVLVLRWRGVDGP